MGQRLRVNCQDSPGCYDVLRMNIAIVQPLANNPFTGAILTATFKREHSQPIAVRGKGDKERIVVLGKAAHYALLTYMTFVRTEAMTDSFFAGWKRAPLTPNTIQKIMDRIARQAGIPRLHAHLLRHTATTKYLVSGGDTISLQPKLGHSILAR